MGKASAVLWCFFGLAGVIVLAVFFWWLNITILQPARHKTIVNDANNAIYNKAWFHDQCAAIRTYDQNVMIYQQAIKDATGSEHDRLALVVAGNQGQENDAINQYNANVRNTDRSIFLDYNEPSSGEACR